MKKLTFLVLLAFSLQAYAQAPLEPSWKTSLRNFITKVASLDLSNRLLGLPPAPAQEEIKMPLIPVNFKKSTDIESYDKKAKAPTEFDRLPNERKRQFDYKFIQELFVVTRKTEAKDEDLSTWLNTLDQGGSREGIYQALVLDDVYAGLEGVAEKPSKKLIAFALKFSEKYLSQTFKTEVLDQLNLYSLKRILTEKSLDLFEYYETKEVEAFYAWYANFSGDLATEYGPLLKSEIRSETSKKYHLEWSRSMPLQHIKSEFIIKIHSVMNGLQLLQE
ncbi:MAG TPA: hypothetical protein VNJ01_04325 [Bacteriovoracaceae bacterium]|nr:hypothetical protein [Bacteriovoracaceae bacterium]